MAAPNLSRARVARVALIVISGDPAKATQLASSVFPSAEVELIPMAELKYGSRLAAFQRLRRARVDVLALSYADIDAIEERSLHELAARAMGASQLVFFDGSGRMKTRATSGRVLRMAPQLLGQVIVGAVLLAAVNAIFPLLGRSKRHFRRSRNASAGSSSSGKPDMAYIRSIGQATTTNIGGTASHTVGIVRAFGDLGHDVHVISRPPAPEFDHPRARVTIVPYRPTVLRIHPLSDLENHLRFLYSTYRLLNRARPDMLYQRHTRFDPSGALLALLLRRRLVLEHEGAVELMAETADPTPCLRTLRTCERLNHRVASSIVAVSEEIRIDLLQKRQVPAAKVIVSPSGVDASRFRPGSGGTERRKELGIPSGTIVVGFSGTFGPWHGVEVLVDAILELSADINFCFLFVGDGGGRGPAQLRLADAHHACIFVGLVSLADMPSYLDACDILVCPTTPMFGQTEFFGSPTKLFEYMAAGKAIVASDIGQVAEVIRDKGNGLLIPTRDPTALATALRRLAQDPELRKRLGLSARDEVLKSHSWTNNANLVLRRMAP
jgi:glycosyltransferase involved in cell wall biosynthesis